MSYGKGYGSLRIAINKLAHELLEQASTVDSMEHTVRELSPTVDELRYELSMLREEVRELTDRVDVQVSE